MGYENKKSYKFGIFVVFALIFIFFVNANDSLAKSINEDEVKGLTTSNITGVELGMDENSTVGLMQTYLNQENVVRDSIAKLKEIRTYMYDNNVPYDGIKLQDAVKKKQVLLVEKNTLMG